MSDERPKIRAVQPVLMVRDVAASIAFYRRLGFEPTFTDAEDAPRYAGVACDGFEIHLQWHDESQWNGPGDRPTTRFVVEAVDALHASFVRAGVTDRTQPEPTAWGTYEFHVRDPDGNGLHFYRDA